MAVVQGDVHQEYVTGCGMSLRLGCVELQAAVKENKVRSCVWGIAVRQAQLFGDCVIVLHVMHGWIPRIQHVDSYVRTYIKTQTHRHTDVQTDRHV